MKRVERRAAWRAVCKRKGLPPGTTARTAWLQYQLPGGRRPFRALEVYVTGMRAAYAKPAGIERQLALAALRPLRHRGHGGKYRTKQRTIFGRNMVDRSVY